MAQGGLRGAEGVSGLFLRAPPVAENIGSETETPRLSQLSYDGTRRVVAASSRAPQGPPGKRKAPPAAGPPANTVFLKP